MKVSIKKTEEEIRKELFGLIQEASRTPFTIDVDPSKCWCELAETRLMQLIILFKPAGVNRYFHLGAIVDHMSRIYDSEPSQSEIYLSDENRALFRQQQRDLCSVLQPENIKRMSFPPKYTVRPNLEEVKRKIDEFYDMKVVETNEGYPDKFDVHSEFFLPDGEFSELIRKKEERSSSVASSTSKKRRMITPDD